MVSDSTSREGPCVVADWRHAAQRILGWVERGALRVEALAPTAAGKTECAAVVMAGLPGDPEGRLLVVPDDEDAIYAARLLSAQGAPPSQILDLGDYLDALDRQDEWRHHTTVLDLGPHAAPPPRSGRVIRLADPYRSQALLTSRVVEWRATRLVPSIARAIDLGRYGGSGWCLPSDTSGRDVDWRATVSRVGRAQDCVVVARHYAAALRDDYGVTTKFATVRAGAVGDLMAARPSVLVLAYPETDTHLLARYLIAARHGLRIIAPERLEDPLLDAIEREASASS